MLLSFLRKSGSAHPAMAGECANIGMVSITADSNCLFDLVAHSSVQKYSSLATYFLVLPEFAWMAEKTTGLARASCSTKEHIPAIDGSV